MKGLNRHQNPRLHKKMKNPNCKSAGKDQGMNSPAACDMVQKFHGLNLPPRPVTSHEKMEKYQRDLEEFRSNLREIVSDYIKNDPSAQGSLAPSFPLKILNLYSICAQLLQS